MLKIAIVPRNEKEQKTIKEFNNESAFRKAMNQYRKNGFKLLTKGWYFNPETKETLYTSKYYYI